MEETIQTENALPNYEFNSYYSRDICTDTWFNIFDDYSIREYVKEIYKDKRNNSTSPKGEVNIIKPFSAVFSDMPYFRPYSRHRKGDPYRQQDRQFHP